MSFIKVFSENILDYFRLEIKYRGFRRNQLHSVLDKSNFRIGRNRPPAPCKVFTNVKSSQLLCSQKDLRSQQDIQKGLDPEDFYTLLWSRKWMKSADYSLAGSDEPNMVDISPVTWLPHYL